METVDFKFDDFQENHIKFIELILKLVQCALCIPVDVDEMDAHVKNKILLPHTSITGVNLYHLTQICSQFSRIFQLKYFIWPQNLQNAVNYRF